jgi:hypothetical protein
MAKGDTSSSQLPGAELGQLNKAQTLFGTLGGGQSAQAPVQQSPMAPSNNFQQMMPQNMMQNFFNRIGNTGINGGMMGGTPQQPYTQSAMNAPPISPVNPQNMMATFFGNLGKY